MALRRALGFCSRLCLITHSCLKRAGGGRCWELCWGRSDAIWTASYAFLGALLCCIVSHSGLFLVSSQFLTVYFFCHSHERNSLCGKKERNIVSKWHRYTVMKISIVKSISYWYPYFCHFLDRTTVWQTTTLLNLYRAQNDRNKVTGIIFKSNYGFSWSIYGWKHSAKVSRISSNILRIFSA